MAARSPSASAALAPQGPRARTERLPKLAIAAALLEGARLAAGQAQYSLFKGPQESNQSHKKWLKSQHDWRTTTLWLNNVTFDIYDDPKVNWTRTTYVQPQVHLWDRYLYNETSHTFTVQRYLDDLTARYGGIDSVLLWPTYPNIGIDGRNQWDLWRAVPGGLDGLRSLTEQFHAAGVKVLWGYNPFDQGLRDEGEPHWTTLARLLKETGADGFNGDTMAVIYKVFVDAGRQIDYPIVGEAELGGYLHDWTRDEDHTWVSASYNTIGWGYYQYDYAGPDGAVRYWREPGVDRAKWLDPRGRRQTHVCDRWAKDRHDAMQYAHFNGVGYESWENVWGVYMTFTQRDGEALRRLQTVWRWLGNADFTSNYQDWVPYAPEVQGEGVYASRWQRTDGTCAWTVVNRDSTPRPFTLNASAAQCNGTHLYDLFAGKALESLELESILEDYGYGAYVLVDGASPPAGLEELLTKMSGLNSAALSTLETSWEPLQQRMLPQLQAQAPSTNKPENMVLVNKTRYHFQTGGVEVEGGCDASKDSAGTGNCCNESFFCPTAGERCYDQCAFPGADTRGVDVQFPWEAAPQRFHDAELEIGPFYIDRHPVTNAEFAEYLTATSYQPRDPYNFLKHWEGGAPRAQDASRPVVWVSLDEAKGYCSWAGKRLPHVYEWQLAAQGTDGRTYPWGNELEASRFPAPGHSRDVPELPEVGSFPSGDSPFGMADAVGLVWQFTDNFEDERTRAAVLKGSSIYNPVLGADFPASLQVGNWYFPVARKVTQHNRLMLLDESYDRAGTLGFRCVADHPDGAPGPYHTHSVASASSSASSAASGASASSAAKGESPSLLQAREAAAGLLGESAALAQCLRNGGARADCRAPSTPEAAR